MLCGYPPFNGDNDKEILAKVSRGAFTFPEKDWGSISREAKDLVQKMLTLKPESRLTA
jgi:calcium-dependent protein kinase